MDLSIDIIFLIMEFTPEACVFIKKSDFGPSPIPNFSNHDIETLIKSAILTSSPLLGCIAKYYKLPNCALIQICSLGNLKMLKWIRNQHPPPSLSEECLYIAARNGHFNVVKWLLEQVPNYIVTKKLLYQVIEPKLYNFLRNKMIFSWI